MGSFIVFLVLGGALYDPLMSAMYYLRDMDYTGLAAKRIKEAMDTDPLHEPELDQPLYKYDIEFNNVTFSYHDTEVLKEVSFYLPQGSLTALVGPSGSGKSTITRLISRFWDVDGGQIKLGSKDIRKMKSDRLMSSISMVFQDVYLFNDTISNNIKIGRKNASYEEVVEAAKAAHCHEFIMALPEGYDTMVGEGGNTLSGGEKQRVSIARAILKNAPVILLDEATASLDPENELDVQKAINRLVEGRTVVIIAHRLKTVMKADNILVLDKGMVVEQGKHEDLLHIGGLYFKLWGLQTETNRWKFSA